MSAVARMAAQWRPLRRRWAGGAFTVLVLAIMLIAVTLRQGHQVFAGATLLTFTLLSWLPLLLRNRFPILVLLATVTVESLHLIFVPFIEPALTTPVAIAAYQPVPLATMTAAWTLAARSPRLAGWIGGIGAASTLFVVSLFSRPATLIGTDLVMFNLVCLATGLGVIVAVRKDKAQRMTRAHERSIREKVIAERLRIARELHDVLAHRLTLVNAQAGIAGYLLTTNPQAAATALQDITDHTRGALDELRATVGLLRQDDDPGTSPRHSDVENRRPQPTLGQLDTMLDGFKSAGTALTLDRHGQPRPLTASADLAAYRIIQEALTNAVKHAPGAPVEVAVRWTDDQLHLRIHNDPSSEPPNAIARTGSGNGLIGMRERIQVCHGTLTASPTPTGGFLIEARIPVPFGNDQTIAHPAPELS